jgi:hypothetical protein
LAGLGWVEFQMAAEASLDSNELRLIARADSETVAGESNSRPLCGDSPP